MSLSVQSESSTDEALTEEAQEAIRLYRAAQAITVRCERSPVAATWPQIRLGLRDCAKSERVWVRLDDRDRLRMCLQLYVRLLRIVAFHQVVLPQTVPEAYRDLAAAAASVWPADTPVDLIEASCWFSDLLDNYCPDGCICDNLARVVLPLAA